MKKILGVFFAILFSTCSQAMENKETLQDYTFYAEFAPPYNYEYQYIPKGIAVELFDKIIKELKLDRSIYGIKFGVWSEIFNQVKSTPKTLLFTTAKTTEREKYFKWAGPIIKGKVGLFGLENSPIEINSYKDIKNYKIGAIKHDIGHDELLKLDISPENLVISDDFDALLKMLHERKIDLISYESIIADWRSETFKKTEKHKIYYNFSSMEYYFAFNINTPDYLINEFQKTLDKIKNDENLSSN